MSYGIEITKDADGVKLGPVSGLDNIPDGLITISGHTPAPGTSLSATLAVTLSRVAEQGYRQTLASASASYIVSASSVASGDALGEAAYVGYFKACGGKSLVSGADLPSWDEQAPQIRAAWVAAAAAVR